MSTIQPPHYTQCGCHTAQGDRQVLSSLVCEEGVAFDTGGALAVAPSTPSAMSVVVESGNAFIQGDNTIWQGMYHVSNDGSVTLPVTAADPSQDRIDLVVAEVRDSTYTGTSCDWRLSVIEGVPGSPPGSPAVPVNAIPLAQFTVFAGATTVPTVTDLRTPYQVCPTAQPQASVPTRLVITDIGDTPIDFNGAYSWVKRAIAYLYGGGGGGGGAETTSAGQASHGRGGGGGGYARVEIFPDRVFNGLLYVTVGGGGSGNAGFEGNDGEITSLSDFDHATVSAGGGVGGTILGASSSAQWYNVGGAGGGVTLTGSALPGWTGDMTAFPGENGFAGGNDANGIGHGGDGGRSFGGQRGSGKSTSGGGGNGSAGGSYGGGGGGAYNGPSQASSRTGGAGSNGAVILYLYDH